MKTNRSTGRKSLRLFTFLILVGVFSTQFILAQSWFDSSWGYRMPITIDNPGTTELSDFQVKITLTGGFGGNFDFTKARTDGADITFTDSEGVNQIPFWIESWVAPTSATVWVKVPSIPEAGATVLMYYGNPSLTPPAPVETPPIGPYTKYVGNPIVAGLSCTNNVLPENLVYENGTYYVIVSNRCVSPAALSLVSSTDLINWVHEGIILSAAIVGDPGRYFDSPCLVKADGYWYIFYSNYYGTWSESDPAPIGIARSTTINGGYSELSRSILTCGTNGTWDDARVSEPYVIQRDNGDWVMVYMGDAAAAGGFEEQIGIAVSTVGIEGPYFKSTGNPVIPFGVTGSLDAGTVADPWVIKFDDTYYIGYTAAPDKDGWNTTYATTTDWVNFPKSNTVILNQGPIGSWDVTSAFRGAVTRVGDNYIFPYTGQGSGGFQFGLATQPVNTNPINQSNAETVFEFYDGFDGGALNTTKWATTLQGSGGTATVSGGIMTLLQPTTGTTITLTGNITFGPGSGMLLESLARHPDANGLGTTAAEVGFGNAGRTNVVRLFDYNNTGFFIRNATSLTGGGNDYSNLMTQTLNNTDYLLHRIFLKSTTEVQYAMQADAFQSLTSNIPQISIPPWFMCVSLGNQARLEVDWIRVRKFIETEPVTTNGEEQVLSPQWTGAVSTDWMDASNWVGGVPEDYSTVNITYPPVNRPHITGTPASPSICNNLTVDPGASVTIDAGSAMTVKGHLLNNGSMIVASTGTLANTSGSLIVGTSSGSGQISFSRYLRPENNMGERHFLSSPVVGQTVSDFTFINGNISQLWEWNELDGTWPIVSGGSFESGKGYNLSQIPNSQGEFTFTGTIADTVNYNASSPYRNGYTEREDSFDYGLDNPDPMIWADGRSWINYGGGGWNLMGNPYTSAMNAADFVMQNTGKFDPSYEALYVYNGLTNQYLYAGAAEIPGYPAEGSFGNFVQAGQGFFVLALYNDVVFNFYPSMQTHNTEVIMQKSAKPDNASWPGLQLKVAYGNKESRTTIVYNENMTAGLDKGYDLGLMSTNPGIDIYTTLVEKDNSVNYNRQALPLGGYDTLKIPIGIDTEEGGDATFSAYTVPIGTSKFWLEDKTTGIFTDLTTKSYSVTIPPKTFGTGRFFIIASTNTPTGTERHEAAETAIRIWTANDKVIIKGEVSEAAFCEIYDLQGKKILTHKLTDAGLNTVDIPSGLNGVFFVRVVEGLKITTRKIAVL